MFILNYIDIILMMNDQDLLRYSRHILLPEIDYVGQEKLLASRIIIIGLGGLGSAAVNYLAASGCGNLTLCDFDDVDLSNLQRQIIHSEKSIKTNKAVSAKLRVGELNSSIKTNAITKKLTRAELNSIISDFDVILDCSDNFETRYAINQIAYKNSIPLVSGAAIKLEGQITTFDFSKKESPCYECLYPNSDIQEQENIRCRDHGVLSPSVGIIGTLQALEAIKIIVGFGEPLIGKLSLFDAKTSSWKTITFNKDTHCKVCSGNS